MSEKTLNFIEHIIEEDLSEGLSPSLLRFRFPPEPNGYLHIGHVKAICLNFNLGNDYNAPVNLRFDDTNPAKEETQFVKAIKKDIEWLGFQWDKECYASDYFQQLFDWAKDLIYKGLAYVDSQSSEQISEQKGTPTQLGTHSPFRNRSIEENLMLFQEMRDGKHQEGAHVLRAKIDMSAPNMLLRDPVMYRILYKTHHRTGDDWCIYPMYDWTHGESDYIEQISHSLCSLEFKPHRELYDWFLDALSPLDTIRPKQREFARLNLSYTVMSKRKLKSLIDQAYVSGWDDPMILDTLKTFPEQPLTFVKSENNTVEISANNGKYAVAYLNGEDFPKAAQVNDPIKTHINGQILATAINATLFASGNDDLRPVMSGVFFQFNTTELTFVATDAHKLVKYTRTDIQADKNAEFIMPKKPLQLLKGILQGVDEDVVIEYNETNAEFSFGNVMRIPYETILNHSVGFNFRTIFISSYNSTFKESINFFF